MSLRTPSGLLGARLRRALSDPILKTLGGVSSSAPHRAIKIRQNAELLFTIFFFLTQHSPVAQNQRDVDEIDTAVAEEEAPVPDFRMKKRHNNS